MLQLASISLVFDVPSALSFLAVHGGTKRDKRKNGDGPIQGTSGWRKSVGGCSSLETHTLFIIAHCRYIVFYATFLFFSLCTLIMETGPVLFLLCFFPVGGIQKVKKAACTQKNTLDRIIKRN